MHNDAEFTQPPLLLSAGVTVESFRQLIASKDDDAGSHILWVDDAGAIHLDLLREGQSPAEYEDEIAHRMRFRYEVYEQGEGHMGPGAAGDFRFVRDLLHVVERDWFHRTRGCG
ncbi:MAG TPA: hypothetical protein VGE67_13710 [Haloferula sp.]